jgi:hypothetical protein
VERRISSISRCAPRKFSIDARVLANADEAGTLPPREWPAAPWRPRDTGSSRVIPGALCLCIVGEGVRISGLFIVMMTGPPAR